VKDFLASYPETQREKEWLFCSDFQAMLADFWIVSG
jgi:hypothetical protein